jgi:hypothetical protein
VAKPAAELSKNHPDALMHILNLTPALQEEFRKAMTNKGVRFPDPTSNQVVLQKIEIMGLQHGVLSSN